MLSFRNFVRNINKHLFINKQLVYYKQAYWVFPGGLVVKTSPFNVEGVSLIPD